LVDISGEDPEFAAVEEEMQSTIREHRDQVSAICRHLQQLDGKIVVARKRVPTKETNPFKYFFSLCTFLLHNPYNNI
jgi:hypothetical protein